MKSFASIPLSEAIKIVVELIFQNKNNLKISKNEFKKFFKFVTFFLKGNLHDQIYGVLLGSPLGLVFASLFMVDHEKNWLQKFGIGEAHLYRRYVDDTFCMINNEIDAEKFFKYLNSKNPNFKFIMNKETNKFLPFLDVLVKMKVGHLLLQCIRRKFLLYFLRNIVVLHLLATKSVL